MFVRFLAWLLSDVIRYRRSVVTVNLSRCFPQKSYEEIEQISKRFYLHFATIFKEMLWYGRCRGEKGRKKLRESGIIRFTNPEVYNRLAAGAKQVMLLQSHCGNWELIGGLDQYEPSLDMSPDRFVIAYLRIHNKWVNRFMTYNRLAPVSDLDYKGYVESSDILRFIIRNKDKPYCYAFNTDQYPYGFNHNVRVRFMHQDTVTITAGAVLAQKMDMAVAFLSIKCREEGGYDMRVIPICEHAAGEDPLAIMQKYYQLLEEDLENQPWNYLWTHKRWK